MNRLKSNPKDALWVGVSVSMVIISVGITFSLIRGSNVDVEALNTKFKLYGITSKNKELTKELKEVSQELKQNQLPENKRQKLEEIEQELAETEQEINQIEDGINDNVDNTIKPIKEKNVTEH